MATSNWAPLSKAVPSSDHPPAMNRSYEGFLRWVSAEALAELCEAAAQEMGFGDLPTTKSDQRAVMYRAFEIYLDQRWERRSQRNLDVGARRRARKRGATIEHFTRQEIIDRDDATCHICGKRCEPREIHLDHVIPLSRGGEHSRANVKVACAECNIRKGATMPSDVIVYDAST